jgi:magnesium transporter
MLTILREEGANIIRSQDQAALPALLANKNGLFWVDLESPTAEEFQVLHEIFNFHPLAVEDAMRPHQRPKVDEFEGYFFLVADEVTLQLPADGDISTSKDSESSDDVQSRQLSAFLGANYLVTVHVDPIKAVANLRERCDHNHRLLEKGADYMLYMLLDGLVDGYFPLLDLLDDLMDDLEDRIVGKPERGILETIFRLKRDLTRLRRFAAPLREVLQTLTTRDFPNIQQTTLPYFRDVADHLFRIYETLDSYRDLMSNMLDAHLSQVSNQMNRVMQRLAVVATIFLPITFITGVFGMNFAVQPWLNTSVWFWLFMMACVVAVIYWWLRHRHWVGH